MLVELSGIECAVRSAGGQTALAAMLTKKIGRHLHRESVSLWVHRGYVPPEHSHAISELTGIPVAELIKPFKPKGQ
jgi:hypothetical protein